MTTHSIWIPVTVVNLVIAGFVPELSTCKRRKLRGSTAVWREARTGRCIDNHQERGHQGEENDGRAKDRPGGPTPDQGRNEDSTNTLSSLVESLSRSHWERQMSAGTDQNNQTPTPSCVHFVKVWAVENRSVERVVIEPLKNSRPSL